MSQERFTVEHRAEESRYVLLDLGDDAAGSATKEIGEASYVATNFGKKPQRIFHHTMVEPEYGGQGLASVLVRHALDYSIAADIGIVPVCPYVTKWVAKHENEYASHVSKPTPKHLEALKG